MSAISSIGSSAVSYQPATPPVRDTDGDGDRKTSAAAPPRPPSPPAPSTSARALDISA